MYKRLRPKIILVFAAPVLAVLLACSGGNKVAEIPQPEATSPAVETPTPGTISNLDWDPAFKVLSCDPKREAPLLDEALENVNLARSTFGIRLSNGHLGDEFTLSWIMDALGNPIKSGCYEELTARALDYYLTQPHPVSGIIRHAATLLLRPPDKEPPIDPAHLPGDFEDAVKALGGEPQGELSEDLKEALTPILFAIVKGIEARNIMDKEAALTSHDPEWWHENGGNLLLFETRKPFPDAENSADRIYLAGERGRRELYRAAAQIAYAVENTDWDPFVGLMGVNYDINTSAGWIRIRDGSDNFYEEDGEDILLFLDLGGNDTHVDDIASNKTAQNPVSVAIDLSGHDTYTYIPKETQYDAIRGLLAADEDGRYDSAVSRSSHFRQGAARNGIALLFDFGDGDDEYQSLRGSQGYAHLGVGGLFDEGGDDTFLSEEASQGSGQFGIGFVITAGNGNDRRYAFTYSQGFGFAGGAGINLDAGGKDLYFCNHGDPDLGGVPLYSSAQLPGKANSSFCQGAGFGLRTTERYPTRSLSGGLGVLRKIEGDSIFEASVFAQGTGFWRGAGIFSVGRGKHQIDALYYAQGGSAHFGVGIAVIGEGNSIFNGNRPPKNMMLGAGHDFSLGVFIKEGGNDVYYVPNMGGGISNCNGAGLFVENGGNDTYIASTDFTLGVGNIGAECKDTRPNDPSMGIFIDAGGEDVYKWPNDELPQPDNQSVWGYSRGDMEFEFGSGIDGENDTGIHGGNGE